MRIRQKPHMAEAVGNALDILKVKSRRTTPMGLKA
jgi:hypothetical protein